ARFHIDRSGRAAMAARRHAGARRRRARLLSWRLV
ncbi:MAG: hypothetical protein AVDCRST_MAG49-4618, partial [uncultured Thermomicrobiales bacterium]